MDAIQEIFSCRFLTSFLSPACSYGSGYLEGLPPACLPASPWNSTCLGWSTAPACLGWEGASHHSILLPLLGWVIFSACLCTHSGLTCTNHSATTCIFLSATHTCLSSAWVPATCLFCSTAFLTSLLDGVPASTHCHFSAGLDSACCILLLLCLTSAPLCSAGHLGSCLLCYTTLLLSHCWVISAALPYLFIYVSLGFLCWDCTDSA